LDLGASRLGSGRATGAVDPVERRRQFQQLRPDRQEFLVENFFSATRKRHGWIGPRGLAKKWPRLSVSRPKA
jgi:hypothetical protein